MTRDNIINQKKIFSVVYIIVCSFIILVEQGMLKEYSSIAIYTVFFINISLVFLILLNNGIDLLFFFLLCLNILLIPIIIQYFSGESYGLLAKNLYPIYIPELLTATYIYNICIIFLSLITNFSTNEYMLIDLKFDKLNNATILFNELVAVMFAIVAFPRLSITANSSERFDMLLPGHAWNQLAVVALLFNLPYLKKRLDVKLVYAFVTLWFLLNGERADITGLVLGLICYYLMNSGKKISKPMIKKVFLAFVTVLLIVLLLNLIVAVRQGNSSISIVSLINGIIITPTTADVGYLYNISIDYFEKFGGLKGAIFKTNVLSAIPLYEPYGFSSIISSANYPNPGGEPLLAEPIMDFGFSGLILISIFDFALFRLVVQFKNNFFKYEYITLLCLIPRIVWYGRNYAYTSILIFVPLMFLMNKFISKGFK